MTIQNSRFPANSISLPSWAEDVFARLDSAGECWAVGGFVRDSLRGTPPDDLDLACSLAPEGTLQQLRVAGYTVIPTGIRHGTVTVLADKHPIEVTTFRADGAYTDSRRPESISPVRTIEEDLARRDFTVNALAWNPARGLIDPCCGLDDLHQGIIRAIGNPATRFSEDALRILRAVRFSSQWGFQIEPVTRSAMIEAAPELRLLSGERIAHEMTKLLQGAYVTDVLIRDKAIIGAALPEVIPCFTCPQHTPYHCYNVWEHITHAVGQSTAVPEVRWATFLHDIGKPETASEVDGVSHFYNHAIAGERLAHNLLKRLHFSSTFTSCVCALVRYHDDPIAPTPKAVRRYLNKLGGNPQAFFWLCEVKKADALAHAPAYRDRASQAAELEHVLSAMLAEGDVFGRKDLAINGTDIKNLGVPQGPAIGSMLEQVLSAVEDHQVANTREDLLAWVKRHHEAADSNPGTSPSRAKTSL